MNEITTKRRPTTATIATVAHSAMAVGCMVLAIYLIARWRPDGVVRIGGALVLTLAAVPYALSGVGLAKGRFWGWLVGVMANAAVTLIFVVDAIDEHYIAWDDAAVAAIFPVLLIVLFWPSVRRWCRRRSALPPRAAGVAG